MVRMAPISEVAMINPRMSKELRADIDRKVAFLPMAAVKENGQLEGVETKILGDVSKGYTYFERGDIIFAKITPCFENGKATCLDNLPLEVGFGSTEFHVLRANHDIDGRYLFHMIWNPTFRFLAARAMTGAAGQKRVPTPFVKDFKIPLPPLSEQKRIAAILDKADAIRRKRQEAIALADTFLRSVFLKMFGDPVTNPMEWDVKSIGAIADTVQYGTSSRANSSRIGLPILRMGNLTYDGWIDLNDLKHIELLTKDRKKFTLKYGDLLFNRTNSPELVGKTAVWEEDIEAVFAGYLVRVQLNRNLAQPSYVSTAMNMKSFKRKILNMAKPSINMSNISAAELKRVEIPVPPIGQQDYFKSVRAKVIACVRNQRLGLKESNNLFSSLQQRAFRGDL